MDVPYPHPTSDDATRIAKANGRRDTGCERRLRSILHRRGLRFRVDLLIRVGDVRVHPDVVFTRWKVAVFVHGCFWHSCPEHQHVPKRNWVPKFAANLARDRRVSEALTAAGWTVVVVWEHDDPEVAADRVCRLVDAAKRAATAARA